jgi:hypothetical protein
MRHGALQVIAALALIAPTATIPAVAQSFDSECQAPLQSLPFNALIERCSRYARSLSQPAERAEAFVEVLKARALVQIYPDFPTFRGAIPASLRTALPLLVAQGESAPAQLDSGNAVLAGAATLEILAATVGLLESDPDFERETREVVERVPTERLIRALVANRDFSEDGVAVGLRMASRILKRLGQTRKAMEVLETATVERPRLITLIADERANILVGLDYYVEAYEVLRHANIREGSAYANVARLAELAGFLIDAQNGYREALQHETNPLQRTTLFLRLAIVAKVDQNPTDAVSFLNEAHRELDQASRNPNLQAEVADLRAQLATVGRLLQ